MLGAGQKQNLKRSSARAAGRARVIAASVGTASLLLASLLLLLGWTLPAEAQTVRCNGEVATIVGTDGDDVLRGTAGRDVIHGRAGDDTLIGFAGNDVLCGGGGNDSLTGHNGNDVLIGGAGNDRLIANAGDDRLLGITGDDILNGGPGTDVCIGGIGRDQGSACETRTGLLRPSLLLQRDNVQLAPRRSVTYNLTLNRNDWIYLNFDNPSFLGTLEDTNLDGTWRLVDSRGETVVQSFALNDPLAPTRILRTGRYRLEMTAHTDGAVFSFRALRAPVSISRLMKNQAAVGRIAIPGEQHRHRFQAAAGERLYLDFDHEGLHPEARWWVVPVGRALDEAVAGSFLIGDETKQIVIPAAGAYDVLIRGNNDELYAYGFTLRTTTRMVRQTQLGESISAGFERPGEVDVYRFSADAGDVLNIAFDFSRDDASRGGTYRIERVGEFDDPVIDRRSLCCPLEVTLETSGTYLVIANARTDQTFPYSISLNQG